MEDIQDLHYLSYLKEYLMKQISHLETFKPPNLFVSDLCFMKYLI